MTCSSWTVVQIGLRWLLLLLQMMLSGSLPCLPSVESRTGWEVQGEFIHLPRTDPLQITCFSSSSSSLAMHCNLSFSINPSSYIIYRLISLENIEKKLPGVFNVTPELGTASLLNSLFITRTAQTQREQLK